MDVMLGRQHLLLSVLTASLLLMIPMTLWNSSFLVPTLFGVIIGSLAPDADSPDAAIFHKDVRGLKGSAKTLIFLFSQLFPAFGYTIKYAIYKPLVFLFRHLDKTGKINIPYEVKEDHRGLLHSLMGIFASGVILTFYLTIFFLVFLKVDFTILVPFAFSFCLGAFLHLVEDSCTKSGVNYMFPFGDFSLSGNISTSNLEDRRADFFTIALVVANLLILFISNYFLNAVIVLEVFVIFGTILLWFIFMKFFAGVGRSSKHASSRAVGNSA